MTSSPTDASRSKLRAALALPKEAAQETVAAVRGGLEAQPRRLPSKAAVGFSVTDCVSEGIDAWWRGSMVGRTAQALTPWVEPYLKPFVRRHYQALLLGGAAVGALVSQFPGRSTRTVLKVAGPVLISGVMLEIAKAGLRQLKRRP